LIFCDNAIGDARKHHRMAVTGYSAHREYQRREEAT
jgi:hypothetical protein